MKRLIALFLILAMTLFCTVSCGIDDILDTIGIGTPKTEYDSTLQQWVGVFDAKSGYRFPLYNTYKNLEDGFTMEAYVYVSSKPSAKSSAVTPSVPILSSLSRMIKTDSSLSSGKPTERAMARRMRRSLTHTVKPGRSVFSKILESINPVAPINSISAKIEPSPKMSISHWVN